MKVTFPHMGNIYIPLKVIFEELAVEVIPPPKCSKRTLEIGTRYAPELICMPFKINLGNYIESIEKGADTIFMLGGCGPCRFGLYNTVQKDILYDLGYDIEMICLEPFSTFAEIQGFLEKLNKISKVNNHLKIVSAFHKGIRALFAADEASSFANKIRTYEVNKGEVNILYAKFEEDIRNVIGYKETIRLIKQFRKKLEEIKVDTNKDTLKIGIVGDIYTISEPFANLYIEKKLTAMGIEVHNSMSPSEYIKEQMDFIPFIHSQKKEVFKAGKNYLNTPIGGYARQTIGNTILYSEKNFDGVIHLLPFTCIPEIVSQSILPTIQKEKNIPVLTLVLDEMTGEGGYLTRLEAFVDVLSRRKEIF